MKEIQKFTSQEAAEQEAQYWPGATVYFQNGDWVMEAEIEDEEEPEEVTEE